MCCTVLQQAVFRSCSEFRTLQLGQLKIDNLISDITLSDIGGRKVDEFICRVMSFVMKNDLAKHFYVYGRQLDLLFCLLSLTVCCNCLHLDFAILNYIS